MNLCDVIGPVMIGPSSSHTAGAARIGRVARQLLGEEVAKAQVDLHGSFAKTWEGHGTDRAVVGGLLGMPVDDQRLRDSRQIAREKGMEVTFRAVEIRDAHPNTMVLHLTGVCGGRVTVQAAPVTPRTVSFLLAGLALCLTPAILGEREAGQWKRLHSDA